LAPQPVIQVQDANSNPVSQAGVVVTAVIASGPSGATLANATATTVASGAATFNGLAITGAAGSYTLRFQAEAAGLTATAPSGPIALGAGAVAAIVANGPTTQAATVGLRSARRRR